MPSFNVLPEINDVVPQMAKEAIGEVPRMVNGMELTVFDVMPKLKNEDVGRALRSRHDFMPFYTLNYICRACTKSFANISELKNHVFINHVCLPCKAYFGNASDLLRHITTQHPAGIQCNLCDAAAHADPVQSFTHYRLTHHTIFSPLICKCSRQCKNRRLDEHLQVIARERAHTIWQQKKRVVTMEVRCHVEIAPSFAPTDMLKFDVFCSGSAIEN